MDDVQWKVQGQGWCEVAMFVGLGMVWGNNTYVDMVSTWWTRMETTMLDGAGAEHEDDDDTPRVGAREMKCWH